MIVAQPAQIAITANTSARQKGLRVFFRSCIRPSLLFFLIFGKGDGAFVVSAFFHLAQFNGVGIDYFILRAALVAQDDLSLFDLIFGFYSFESLNQPPTIYSYDTANKKSSVFFAEKVLFISDRYEVRQVFFHSKDGTRVPMFIVGRKGLPRDGSVPTLMTAYGGFNLSMTPEWNPEYAWWLEQGGYFALPNLRGGSEYGEQWHEAGMFEHKQNVFDDFYGAAEYLIANHYTTAKLLAIRGRSNGGLLMGAAMTQRPDLFGAIWCGFPLLDMLRYQNFLVGRFWTTEYGSSENPSQFNYLQKYSPYQNVKAGTKYPAIMFFSGDSDTRVAPLHARKMTAAMQAASGSNRPILLHYELKAGHSSGVSVHQLVDDYADELAFLWNETYSVVQKRPTRKFW